jgi:hypothetical protein
VLCNKQIGRPSNPVASLGRFGGYNVDEDSTLALHMKNESVRSCKTPSKAAIQRAVASSTAIETGKPIRTIEAQLRAKRQKFRNLGLAR